VCCGIARTVWDRDKFTRVRTGSNMVRQGGDMLYPCIWEHKEGTRLATIAQVLHERNEYW